MKLPRELGPIHFVGIGGIGMSGIAEVLINHGHKVQGSHLSDNTTQTHEQPLTRRLSAQRLARDSAPPHAPFCSRLRRGSRG